MDFQQGLPSFHDFHNIWRKISHHLSTHQLVFSTLSQDRGLTVMSWMGSSCRAPEMHPRILQGFCVERPSLEGLRGCHVIPPQAGMRTVSLPGAIPLYLFLLMSVLQHSWRNAFAFRQAQPPPTCPKTSRTWPSTQAHDFLGTAWFSGYRPNLGRAVAYTKTPQCSLASPFSPHTWCYHGTSAQRAVPHLPDHTSACWPHTFLTLQSKTLQTQLRLKRHHIPPPFYPSFLRNKPGFDSHGCMHVCTREL